MKIGLEIHQQLKTNKLFCRCPSVVIDREPDVLIRRELRPTAGEAGRIDEAALQEFLKGRKFAYEYYRDGACLVELDEEPPHEMDGNALEITLQLAQALRAKPVHEIQVMRKTILDGSCVSGFQRTALVATNGWTRIGEKTISIDTITVEEDSSRIVEQKPNEAIYSLDRAGVPLIEIATGPQIDSPEEARRVAEHLGLLLRASRRVARGLGTIRQDLNISIEGGNRVEIKGVQRLDLIEPIIQKEVQRQQSLIDISHELEKRGASVGEPEEVTPIFKNVDSKVAQAPVVALLVKGFAGFMKKEIHSGKHLGKEVSEYLKAQAQVGGFVHTDELPNYGIGDIEKRALKSYFRAGDSDLVVFVCGPRAERAAKALKDKLAQLVLGVPRETRRANDDGSTTFLRTISGAARMYPETDVPPIVPPTIIKPFDDPAVALQKLKELGLNEKLAREVLLSERFEVFETAVATGATPTVVAVALEETIPWLEREKVDFISVKNEKLNEVFALLAQGKITKDILPEILRAVAHGKPLENFVKEQMTLSEIETAVDKLVEEKGDYIKTERERAVGGLMGILMNELKGRVDGKMLIAVVQKKVKETLR